MTHEPCPQYVFAYEQMVVGFKGGDRACPFNGPKDSLFKHNVLMGPVQSRRCRDSDGEVVNPYEKPPWLAYHFTNTHTSPNDQVLVLGAGAGGEVVGALGAGRNVVAIEADQKQFSYLVSRICTLQNEMPEKSRWEDFNFDLLHGKIGHPGYGIFHPNPVAEAPSPSQSAKVVEVQVPSELPQPKSQPQSPALPLSQPPIPRAVNPHCPACGHPILDSGLFVKTVLLCVIKSVLW